MTLSKIDHLLYAAPTLEVGMDDIEQRLGVRPVPAGRHPKNGTHNALLSLGSGTYLEVIAPDPSLPTPAQGRILGFEDHRCRLLTWVMRAEDIDAVAAKAEASGLALGEVQAGQRETPDGAMLHWRFSDPTVRLLDGAVPFLIAWGDTPHPSDVMPQGGQLEALRVEHPQVSDVRSAFDALAVDIDVQEAEKFRLIATLKTPAGRLVELA